MQACIIVFVGAGLGGMLRHFTNLLAAHQWGINFPYGTFIVNIIGSLLMGIIAGYFALRGESSPSVKLFLATGILGGFTTFSAFSLEVALMYERGDLRSALLYSLSSVVLSVSGIFIGMWAIRHFPS